MDQERKRQILRAQAMFEARERLARRLAEKGIYVFGELRPNVADEGPADPFPEDRDRG